MIESACSTELAVSTVSPTPLSTRAEKLRILGSSSTTRIVFMLLSGPPVHQIQAANSDLRSRNPDLEVVRDPISGPFGIAPNCVFWRMRVSASRRALEPSPTCKSVAPGFMLAYASRPPLEGILRLRSLVRYPKLPCVRRRKLPVRPMAVLVRKWADELAPVTAAGCGASPVH